MTFIHHPLIRQNTIEEREYQKRILETAKSKNLLAVLPTGLGKTPLAVLLVADRLEKFPDSKILIMAPTRPLTNQHFNSLKKFLDISEDEIVSVTGFIKPELRAGIYKSKKIILATPQTIQKDLEAGRISLRDFSLVVFDEAHHAIGGYAYPFVAEKYLEQARNPRILALSASPGGTEDKIQEICKNLHTEAVEIRSERDHDVSPYVHTKMMERVEVQLPESFVQIKQLLAGAYMERLERLKKFGFVRSRHVRKKDLLMLSAKLSAAIGKGYKKAFLGIGPATQAIKIEHALGLLETQSIGILEKYWTKIRQDKSASAEMLKKDAAISYAMELTRQLAERGSRHPKISKLCSILNREFSENPGTKVIIFANYRDTVNEIVEVAGKIDGVRAIEFFGQSGTGTPESGSKGMSQKEQVSRLTAFRDGIYNTLVCTSIGEEGLDIADANLAVFYDTVSSPLRSIQRRGRVGRASAGRVITLITMGTRDEAWHWSSVRRERNMREILTNMQKTKSLGDF